MEFYLWTCTLVKSIATVKPNINISAEPCEVLVASFDTKKAASPLLTILFQDSLSLLSCVTVHDHIACTSLLLILSLSLILSPFWGVSEAPDFKTAFCL